MAQTPERSTRPPHPRVQAVSLPCPSPRVHYTPIEPPPRSRIPDMKTRTTRVLMLALALALIGATLTAMQAGAGRTAPPARPRGPCDVYAAAGDPCVAAHSTTRALYAAYNG